jgi:hypothetical protein
MFCSKCGTQIPDDAVFCPACGTKTVNQGTSTQQDSAQDTAQQNSQQTTWNTPPQPNNNPNMASQPSTTNPYVTAALAYIPILFWLPLAVDKNDAFGRKTANQGLLLLIFGAGCTIVVSILSAIIRLALFNAYLWGLSSVIGVLFGLISLAISGLTIAAAIVGLVKGLKGQFFEVPIIGKIHIIK